MNKDDTTLTGGLSDKSLGELTNMYGREWLIRDGAYPSATRLRQIPLSVLHKTDLAMTVFASDLVDLARRLEEQTQLASQHLGKE